jgi:hypothetical protein
MNYYVFVEMKSGVIDDFEVTDHYFEAGFLHLVHKNGTVGQRRKYTTSISGSSINSVTTADER